MFFLIVSLANVLTQYLDLKDDKGLKLISDLLWFIFSNILQVLKDNFWHYFYQIDFRSFFLNTICIIVLGNILYYILNSVWNLGIRGIFNLTNNFVKALINICSLFTGFCEYKRKQRIENSTQNVERVIKKRNRSPKKSNLSLVRNFFIKVEIKIY